MVLKALFLLSLLVYRPINFSDPTLSDRSDLKGRLKKLAVQFLDDTRTRFISIEIAGVKLNFMSEIAELLEKAKNVTPSLAVDHTFEDFCQVHAGFVLPQFDLTKANCMQAKSSLQAALLQGANFCRQTYAPESFFQNSSPIRVDRNRMQSAEGVIELAGAALSHTGAPGNLVDADFRTKMRAIILKIRSETLLSVAAKSKQMYSEILIKNPELLSCLSADDGQSLAPELQALSGEVKSAENFIASTIQAGKLEAERDRAAVLAKGRQRDLLPYPSLTDSERELFSTVVGAVYWRIRGGGLIQSNQGTQFARRYFMDHPFRMLGQINGAFYGEEVAGTFLLPLLLKGWGQYMDMGHSPGQLDKFHDLVFMTDRGAYQVEQGRHVLRSRGFDDSQLAIGGLQMGPCYYFAWEYLQDQKWGADLEVPYLSFLDGATSWGELCTGASLGLGLSRSLLGGYLAQDTDFNRD